MSPLVLLVACSDGPAGSDTGADTLPAAVTQWWHGGSRGHDPDKDSTEVPEDLWIARTVDPAAARIHEVVVADGVWEVVYEVVGDQFDGELPTADGTLMVTGALYGTRWAWDGWGSASTYVDGPYLGMYVTSIDTIRADGGLDTTKMVYTAEDEAVWQIDEASDPTTEAEFEAARAAAE